MWSRQQVTVFLLTFLAYALFHAARKTFSNTKVTLEEQWNLSAQFMGYCDTTFMVSYALFLIIMGMQVDHWNPKKILVAGLVGSFVILMLIGLSETIYLFDAKGYLLALMFLHGIFQATGWPSCISLISHSFTKNYGAIFGAWSVTQSVGNVGGTVVTAAMLSYKISIVWIFLLPAVSMLACGIACMLGISNSTDQHSSAHNKSSNYIDLQTDDTADQAVNDEIAVGRLHHASSEIELSDSTASTPRTRRPSTERSALLPLNGNENGKSDSYSPHAVTPSSYHMDDTLLHASASKGKQLYSDDHGNFAESSDVSIKHIDVEPIRDTMHNVSLNVPETLKTMPLSTAIVPLTFIECIFYPDVMRIAFAHSTIKLVNYTAFFWFPYYLHTQIGLSEAYADNISTLYDIGSVFGSIMAGWLSDRLKRRIMIIQLMILLSMAAVMLMLTFQAEAIVNGTLVVLTPVWYVSCVMFVLGFLIGGPANLLPSTCVSDLCQRTERTKASTGRITGLIDGTGTVGAAVGPTLVAALYTHYSWSIVFMVLTLVLVVAMLILLPMLMLEIRGMFGSDRHTAQAATTTNGHIAANGIA